MLIFLHQLSKEVRNCNRYFFFHWKNVLSRKKGLQKKGGFSAFPSKLFFFLKMVSKSYFYTLQKQSPGGALKKGALWNLAKFTGKHLWQSLSGTLLKKRLWRRCFPVNFAKFLRTTFLLEHLQWLLLTLEFLKTVFSSMGSPNLQL